MSNTHYNGFEPKEVLTAEQIEEGWGICKKGKPVHFQRYKNFMPPITSGDDPRRLKGIETNKRKGEIKKANIRLEDELRAFKREAISEAKDRVDNGEIEDAISMLQNSLLEIDILLSKATTEATINKLLDTKIKYINSYANLTLGSVGTTSVQDEEVKEQVTQEDLDKKFAEFSGKFEVVDGGKKDVG